MVARNVGYCPRKSRTLAYCSLVGPKLEYCASVRDPHQQQDIESLEKVNRRATRVVYNKSWRDRNVSPTALLKELGWPPLEERRHTQRLCMMYKIVHGLVAVPPTRLVKPNRQLRGHRYKYQHISTNCEQSKHSFYPRTIREWNSLDANIAEAPSLEHYFMWTINHIIILSGANLSQLLPRVVWQFRMPCAQTLELGWATRPSNIRLLRLPATTALLLLLFWYSVVISS